MDRENYQDLQKLSAMQMSGSALKQHVVDIVNNSSQCKVILECVNHDTGEYRIVLEGVIEEARPAMV